MHRGNRYIVVVPDAIIFKRIGRKRSIGRRRDAAFVSAVVKSKALSQSGSLGRHKERAQTARKRDRRNVRDRRMACGIARRVAFVARVTIRRRGLPCWRTSALREGRRQAQDEKGKTEETPCRRCDQLAADARGKKKRKEKRNRKKEKENWRSRRSGTLAKRERARTAMRRCAERSPTRVPCTPYAVRCTVANRRISVDDRKGDSIEIRIIRIRRTSRVHEGGLSDTRNPAFVSHGFSGAS